MERRHGMPWYAKIIIGSLIGVFLSGSGFFIGLWITHVERKLILIDEFGTKLELHSMELTELQSNQMEILSQLKEINVKIDSRTFPGKR